MKLGYKNDLKSRIVAIFLACIGFAGFAGLHRFYKGKILTGLLWFFTCGLFFIGTFVDFILLIKDLISFIKASNLQSTQNNFQSENQFNDTIVFSNEAPKFFDGIPLSNNYKCEKLCQIRGEEPDISKLKERDRLQLVPEPQNAYDDKAIAVYHGTDKLGYIYRGKVQDIVNEFLADNQTKVLCFISKILAYEVYLNIGCYSHSRSFKPNKEMSFKLIGTSSAKIQYNIGSIDPYEDLGFEMDSDKNLIEFYTKMSIETIGYAPTNKTFILDSMSNPSKYDAYVSEIEENDNGNYSVYVTIEYEE